TVEVAVDLGPFEKGAAGNHLLKHRRIDEVVILALDLSRTWLAGGMAHRERHIEPRKALAHRHQALDERRFARTRGRGEDEQLSGLHRLAQTVPGQGKAGAMVPLR